MYTSCVQIQVYLSFEHTKNVQKILWAWARCAEFWLENIYCQVLVTINYTEIWPRSPILGCLAEKGHIHGAVLSSFSCVIGIVKQAQRVLSCRGAPGTFLGILKLHDKRLVKKTVFFHLQLRLLEQVSWGLDCRGMEFVCASEAETSFTTDSGPICVADWCCKLHPPPLVSSRPRRAPAPSITVFTVCLFDLPFTKWSEPVVSEWCWYREDNSGCVSSCVSDCAWFKRHVLQCCIRPILQKIGLKLAR